MAVKKTDAAKVEKKVEEVKAAEKKAPAKAAAKKPAAKKPAAKKAPAKKAATKATAAKVSVVVEYAGGQKSTDDIVKKALEVSGKKSVKSLNVYYQPENGMVYFTADGEQGEFNF